MTSTNALSRPLRALAGLVLAAGLLLQPGLAAADADSGETTTYTPASGAPDVVDPADPVSDTTCLAAYGPREEDKGKEFCFRGPEKVVVGQPIVLTGVSGFLATDGKTGSVVNFFLDAEKSGDPNTVHSRRALTNPATGKKVADTRSHAVVQARPDGTWTATIPWPTVDNTTLTQAEIDTRFAPGTQHSIRILTGSLLPDPADRQRGGSQYFVAVSSLSDEVEVVKPPAVDEDPDAPRVPDDATCTAKPADYTFELAPGMKAPAANLGGTIQLRGEHWCNLVGGGSLIAIKINAGGYQHLAMDTAAHYDANLGRETGASPASISKANKTIWYVIEADSGGSFDVEIPLPTGKNSVPEFTVGSYTLQLLTRTLSADPYYGGTRRDPSRSVVTPEFTVVAKGQQLDEVTPGKPAASPDPLHATDDLTKARRGGLTLDQQRKRWVLSVPKAKPGDWVYVNAYDGDSPRFPWGQEWFKVSADGEITVPLKAIALPEGRNKVSVQDRDGKVLGWALASVVPQRTGLTTKPKPVMKLAPAVKRVGAPKPAKAPAQPVKAYDELTAENAGKITLERDERSLSSTQAQRSAQRPGSDQRTRTPARSAGSKDAEASKADPAKTKIVMSVPGVKGGDWVYLFLYTETGRVAGADWVQVGSDQKVNLTVGRLPDGAHKLALVDAKGALLGWAGVDGPKPLAAPEDVAVAAPVTAEPVAAAPQDTTPLATAAPAAGSDGTATLALIGAAVLVLAGSAVAVILIQTPSRPRP